MNSNVRELVDLKLKQRTPIFTKRYVDAKLLMFVATLNLPSFYIKLTAGNYIKLESNDKQITGYRYIEDDKVEFNLPIDAINLVSKVQINEGQLKNNLLQLTSLSHVWISNITLRSEHAQTLLSLPNLISLKLSWFSLKSDSISLFSKFVNLKELEIVTDSEDMIQRTVDCFLTTERLTLVQGNKVDWSLNVDLSKMSKLKEVTFENFNVCENTILSMTDLVDLLCVRLINVPAEEDKMQFVKALKGVKAIAYNS